MPNPVGRPPDIERDAWMLRFGMSEGKAKELSDIFMRQLSLCKSDEARRIILGITIKERDLCQRVSIK
jgi:hypothetical protein